MEALISAVLSDIVGRAISFMIEKCCEQTTTDEDLQRLRELLLRIHVVVEEAEARHVTNQGMICQVRTMREQMLRGYFLLDAFRCREKKSEGKEVSRFLFAQSKFNPAKRFRLLSSKTQTESMVIARYISMDLKQVTLVLESMVSDMKEFAIFLMSYPRICRQPYGAYLYLNKYMFGRQMEREQAISFLLQAEPTGKLGVLAIVGPGFIGKSTFVEHVCEDERVRDYFSLILFYSKNDLKDETVRTFRDNCVIRHQNITSDVERSLVVIELLGDVDKGTWRRLLHTCERCMTHGSKIIITSRSENMASFGTTEAIQLNCLSREAYWYFFKMLVFGSMDLEEHPKLISIAMELALEMRGSFISAYHVAAILRENFSARFWCEFLSHVREHTQNNISLLGEYPVEEDRPRYAWSMAKTRRFSEDIKFVLRRVDNPKGPAAHGEVPRIPVLDLLSGSWSSMPRKFEILCWRSVIPPYYSYVYACEFLRHENTAP
ncbi:putative disease resistance RPP13-like protein 1 [Lolium rigidum]|uniref:putative disease resistance RPP13-like protein 1 n=1 Tax=Lolium rigidum TaxID=89674 RepID=UPI001F5C4A9F|nr:putative disease resistance RPP13-like protein 1 [Lolium rigidum]